MESTAAEHPLSPRRRRGPLSRFTIPMEQTRDCRRKGTFRDHDSIMNYGLHNYGLHLKRKLTFQNPYVRIQNCAEEDSEYHPESSFFMRLCAKICRRQVFACLYRRVPPLEQILRKTRKQIVNRMRKMNGNSKI